MTDREKLIAVLNEIEDDVGFICDACGESKKSICIESFADHLIAHGVTVKEPQKPTCRGQLEDNGFFFLERKEEEEVYLVVLKEGWEVYFVDFVDFVDFVGTDSLVWYDKVDYGKTWRCWAEKPTEEERKAAEWET